METNLVFRNDRGEAVTTSFLVAQTFNKNHAHVLRDIDNLGCSEGFHKSNFGFMFNIKELPNGGSRKERYCVMTKDGFTFLAMGYTGKKASEFKEKYIAAFNAMEQQLNQIHQDPPQYMPMQMMQQMMQQMVTLCSTMMQCLGQMSIAQPIQDLGFADKKEPKRETGIKTEHLERIPKKPGVLIGYSRLSREYPGFIHCTAAAKTLKSRGVDVNSRYLFDYLRRNGYLHTDNEWYNCPTDDSVRNGYMIGIAGSGQSGRNFHTPFLSPSFVDLLEQELREKNIGVPRLFESPSGKEEQS